MLGEVGRSVGCLSIALVCVTACTPGGPSQDGAVVSDSSGVRITSHVGADRPLAAEASRAFELGGAGAGPESFYQLYPRWISVGTQGRIAILNRVAHEVSVFDSTGSHVFSFGREGDGPGELAYPTALMVRPDGEISVFDYRKRALVRFASGGSTLDQEPMTVPFNGFLGMVATLDGHILLSQTAPRGAGDVTRRVLYMSDADTAQLGPSTITSAGLVQYESCGMRLTLPPLFASEVMWASNGRRTAVVAGPEYSVLLFDESRLVGIIRRAVEPEVVTEAVVERELGEGERWGASGQECVVPPREVIEARGHADALSVVQDLAVSPEGAVWVKRRVPGAASSVVDVFTDSGAYRGTVASTDVPFPVSFLPDGRVVAIERDEVDVDRLAIYRVELSAR